MKPSKELLNKRDELKQAIENVCKIEPIIKAIQQKVLEENYIETFYLQFEEEKENKRILDYNLLYLAEEQEAEVIFDICHEEYLKAGFNIEEKYICPLLVAQEELREAKRNLVAQLVEIVPTNSVNVMLNNAHTKEYQQFVDTSMKYLEQF